MLETKRILIPYTLLLYIVIFSLLDAGNIQNEETCWYTRCNTTCQKVNTKALPRPWYVGLGASQIALGRTILKLTINNNTCSLSFIHSNAQYDDTWFNNKSKKKYSSNCTTIFPSSYYPLLPPSSSCRFILFDKSIIHQAADDISNGNISRLMACAVFASISYKNSFVFNLIDYQRLARVRGFAVSATDGKNKGAATNSTLR